MSSEPARATAERPGRQAGRVAIVTGAAQGLGLAFSRALAAEGADVVLADINEEGARRAAAQASPDGGRTAALRVDVTSPEDVETMVRFAVERFGRLDVLVNNAGRFPVKPLDAMSLDDWRAVMALNLDAVFFGIRAALPVMRGQRYGRIINIASTTVFHGTAGLAHYAAAKAGVIGLTRAAASELGRDGITVNAIAPGLTLTEGMKADPRMVAVAETRLSARAVPRHALPDDLVPTMLFLASPEADFVTGQTVSVNGGEVKL